MRFAESPPSRSTPTGVTSYYSVVVPVARKPLSPLAVAVRALT